jgi:hypothetical protein
MDKELVGLEPGVCSRAVHLRDAHASEIAVDHGNGGVV